MQASEAAKGTTKSPEAFRTISEASTELGVPQHVLRFWETKFSFIRPMKRAGGRRFYRPQDIAILKGVRTLLHEGGYTIKGVQRLQRENGTRVLIGSGEGEAPPPMASVSDAEADTPIIEQAEDRPEALFEIKPVHAKAAAEEPVAPGRDMAILKSGARGRLEAALRDIEQVKAAIDTLLAGRED